VNFEENPSLLKEKKNVKRTVGLINHAIELAKPIEGKKKKKKKKIHYINSNNNIYSFWIILINHNGYLTNIMNLLKKKI